jgi:hypothetical protein
LGLVWLGLCFRVGLRRRRALPPNSPTPRSCPPPRNKTRPERHATAPPPLPPFSTSPPPIPLHKQSPVATPAPNQTPSTPSVQPSTPQAWEAVHRPSRDWYLSRKGAWPELRPGVAGFVVQVTARLPAAGGGPSEGGVWGGTGGGLDPPFKPRPPRLATLVPAAPPALHPTPLPRPSPNPPVPLIPTP